MVHYKRKTGVPKGYTHDWKYLGKWHEKKIGKGKWKIDFRATKGRRVRGRHPNQPNIGTRIKWKINAVQHARKTSRGTYQTRMIGTKRLIKIKRR